MTRTAHGEKVIVLGVDGMDPRLTKRMVNQNKLPNIQKLIERGACREDLVLLGALPTITPPMWTTLSTGAYPETHGVTCFFNQSHEALDEIGYALDSHNCKAEQLWEVFAEAGKKTLVWHWPGCSWPPKGNDPNLHIVDGLTPGYVNAGVGAETEKMILASTAIKQLGFKAKAAGVTGAGCVLDDLETDQEGEFLGGGVGDLKNILFTLEEGEMSLEKVTFDVVNSPILMAEEAGWIDAPQNAKEFYYYTSNTLVRRPCLILANEAGIYDRVAIYKTKNDVEPLAVLHNGSYAEEIIDEINKDGQQIRTNRPATILELTPDGNKVRIWMGGAVPIDVDYFFHPTRLLKSITDNVGPIKSVPTIGGSIEEFAEKILLPTWEVYTKWQAESINYLIEQEDYQAVFSHIHNVDLIGHLIWRFAKKQEGVDNDPIKYQQMIESVYQDTDRYIGRFLHLLDEGWTIFITSDHGFLCPQEKDPILMAEAMGVNATVMYELGYTGIKKDADGQLLHEIDWETTRAVATRTCHIWINLKGRNKTGIVEPEDKYALEEQIISDLYNYRDQHGRRIISIAMRNKEAALLGLSGPECGDIIYMGVEGPNRGHCDTYSTAYGAFETSLSPIFIACGQGIKQNFKTTRVIRQVDFAPTLAAVMGTRMPHECEGAPAYQIFAEEF